MLQIFPRLTGQKFEDPPFEEEILSFIRDLGHTREIKVLTDVNVNNIHQPWRSFTTIINMCLNGKTTGLDSLRLSRKVTQSGKKRKSALVPKAKGLETLSEQCGSGDGADTQLEVPNEQQQKDSGTDKGAGDKPEEQVTNEDDLYRDVKVLIWNERDAEMTNAQVNQDTNDTHVTLTTVPLVSAHVEEHGQKVDDLEDQPHQEFNIGNDDVTPERKGRDDVVCQWNPSSSPTLDHKWHKTKTIDNKPPQPWITQLAQALLRANQRSVFRWHNPEGKLYPHDLSKPLSLILNERGCQVIPLDHFINNDHEYLKGGSSSKKYTTSITKTKAADYGQVKWIEVKDDQLYKFRECDFKRLRRQDIKDMLLLLVQDKLTNLNLDERYALNVALRMFTRRIVIQERVEDLQLGFKSY
ncbi:hypothetical protein Tco_0833148 [Tanacetum coccineum]